MERDRARDEGGNLKPEKEGKPQLSGLKFQVSSFTLQVSPFKLHP